MAIAANPVGLNTDVTDDTEAHEMSGFWADGLVQLSASYKVEPELATSWKSNSTATVWTFYLRHGVKWSDGVPFTSADVAFTLKAVLQYLPNSAGALPTLLSAVTTPNADTVVIHLKAPYSPLLVALSDTNLKILPKHIYDKGNPATNPAK